MHLLSPCRENKNQITSIVQHLLILLWTLFIKSCQYLIITVFTTKPVPAEKGKAGYPFKLLWRCFFFSWGRIKVLSPKSPRTIKHRLFHSNCLSTRRQSFTFVDLIVITFALSRRHWPTKEMTPRLIKHLLCDPEDRSLILQNAP